MPIDQMLPFLKDPSFSAAIGLIVFLIYRTVKTTKPKEQTEAIVAIAVLGVLGVLIFVYVMVDRLF